MCFHNSLLSSLIPALGERGKKRLITRLVQDLLQDEPEKTQANATDTATKVLQSTYSKVALDSTDFDDNYFHCSSAKKFIDLLARSLTHGLKPVATQLLDATWTNINAYHKGTDSNSPKLPKETIPDFLHSLGRLLQDHEVSRLDSTQQLFSLLIRQYMYANPPSYPKKLPGRSFKPRGCGKCQPCQELDDFLRGEDRSEHEFHVSQDDRWHLECKLNRTVLDYNYNGETNMLKVSKRQGKEFEQDLKAYNNELTAFEKPFAELRNEYIKGLLGDAVYRERAMEISRLKGNSIIYILTTVIIPLLSVHCLPCNAWP